MAKAEFALISAHCWIEFIYKSDRLRIEKDNRTIERLSAGCLFYLLKNVAREEWHSHWFLLIMIKKFMGNLRVMEE